MIWKRFSTLAEFQRRTSRSFLLWLLLIFLGTIFLHRLVFEHLSRREAHYQSLKIQTSIQKYASTLSEQLAIIASTDLFIDFLHSGSATRQDMEPNLTALIARIRNKDIVGVTIRNKIKDDLVYSFGEINLPTKILLSLCYLNRELDQRYGVCENEIAFYIATDSISSSIAGSDTRILPCLANTDCFRFNFAEIDHFGSFKIAKGTNLPVLAYMESPEVNYLLYLFEVLLFLALSLFGIFYQRRFSRFLSTYVADPIRKMTGQLQSEDGRVIPNADESDLLEIQCLYKNLQDWSRARAKIGELEISAQIGELATHVAHDIRSPLAVLESLQKEIISNSKEQGELLRSSIRRIQSIAEDLLLRYREKKSQISIHSEPKNFNVNLALKRLIEEKVCSHRDRPSVRVLFKNCAYFITASFSSSQFERVVSNVLNNAIEAILHSGDVTLRIKVRSELEDIFETDLNYFLIEIEDNGCGIPADKIKAVLHNGLSLGKEKGSGLGLSYVRHRIREWGGKIEIKSELGSGTVVRLYLPYVSIQESKEFRYKKNLGKGSLRSVLTDRDLPPLPWDVVLVDDDMLNRHNWVRSARRNGQLLLALSNLNELRENLPRLRKDINIFLDSDLGGEFSERGEEIVPELINCGFSKIFLATGHNPEKFTHVHGLSGIVGKRPPFPVSEPILQIS